MNSPHLPTSRPQIMGILNVTPDSFSDGGRYLDFDAAVAHGLSMRDEGADIIDVGGESTRPGASRVDAATESSRVVDIVQALSENDVPVSIDTTRSEVAAAAIEAGATIINDVSGGLADPQMSSVARESGARWVLMHWRGHSKDMQKLATYEDVVAEVHAELMERVAEAEAAGVAREKLIIDPGIGFAKLPEHNWALSAHLSSFVTEGYPVLFGSSRKSYLGKLLADGGNEQRPASGLNDATLATSVLAFEAGAWGVRVHDVRGTADAREVWMATKNSLRG
ncbi:dihydropteroate synthase [Natronoglycomyces albus]|uniref:Dihydropteroate synthase n=1 Tax=Natronoglycomyces albus TaxID=2811108 RepID=A0A895XPB4_9ACTN|nr:dihydropteroate synthase [Natronoglycomyces albus]QSB05592.1 dihydropteroate synthase [Natronoglycomyces albus]